MLLLPERRIQGKEHPNPDLLFYKLLYQAISRAREKLCVLVVENYKLFSDILNIKFDMLSRYQYKENYTNTTLSVKKLNRFTKKIKDKLSELEKNNAITISETVDIINDELMGGCTAAHNLSTAAQRVHPGHQPAEYDRSAGR